MSANPTARTVEAIVEEFAERLRRGENPNPSDYLEAHPDLAAALRPLLRSIAAIERAKASRSTTTTDHPTRVKVDVDRMGEYRLVREIGRGGMGVVYEAVQESLQRSVALKVLPPSAFLDAAKVERFKKEAETASRLNHPGIVPIYGVGEENGVHFYAMMLVRGAGLDGILRDAAEVRRGRVLSATPAADAPVAERALAWFERGPAPDGASKPPIEPAAGRAGRWRRIARLARDAAEALAFAHRHGVLHRDVKPSNLLVEPDGRVWIMDFGIAKTLDQKALTMTGEFLGTLQYSAPEQIDGFSDERSDVYSIGLTLYEMLTLARAFQAKGRRELLRRVKDGIFRSPQAVDPTVPRDLATIVAKATAFEPAHRYASAAALADDLDRFLRDLPIRARDVSIVERSWRWVRRNPVLATLAFSTVVALVTAGIVGWTSYWKTRTALARESAALFAVKASLREAAAATARAESNLALSLAAFDGIFDAIAGRDETMKESGGMLAEVPALLPMSTKEIDTLETVLAFYDRFAVDNSSNDRLREDTARAQRRIGDIRRWFGDFDGSRLAYERALELFEGLGGGAPNGPHAVDCAVVRTNLAILHVWRGAPDDVLANILRARSALKDLVGATTDLRARRELARTYSVIGWAVGRIDALERIDDRRPVLRRRQIEDSPVHYHGRALEIARSIARDTGDAPADRLRVARALRQLAQAKALSARRQDDPRNEMSEALAILDDVAHDFHEVPEFRLELVEARITAAELETSAAMKEEGVSAAVDGARRLVLDYPGAPVYVEVLARSLFRLGEWRASEGAVATARIAFEESLELRRDLGRKSPKAVEHVGEAARTARAWAALERQADDPSAARRLLEGAEAEVSAALEASPLGRALNVLARAVHGDLAELLDSLGEPAAAAAMRSKRTRLFELPPLPGFGPPPFGPPGRGPESRPRRR